MSRAAHQPDDGRGEPECRCSAGDRQSQRNGVLARSPFGIRGAMSVVRIPHAVRRTTSSETRARRRVHGLLSSGSEPGRLHSRLHPNCWGRRGVCGCQLAPRPRRPGGAAAPAGGAPGRRRSGSRPAVRHPGSDQICPAGSRPASVRRARNDFVTARVRCCRSRI